MTTPYRIGLLGASRIAPKAIIAPAAESEDANATLVAASSKERAEDYAKEHALQAVESYDALIAHPDIDIIYNGLAPSQHADLTIAALEAGKHVICEKPFARTMDECEAMLAAAEKTGKRLFEAYHYRYHPVIARVMELMPQLEGAITLDAFFDVPIPPSKDELRWRSDLGGGAMMDLGCYPLHVCRTLAGAKLTSIQATAEWDEGFDGLEGVDKSMSGELGFENGILALTRCSMTSKGFGAEVAVHGDNGWIRLENFVAPQMGHELRWEINGTAYEQTLTMRPTYSFQLDAIVEGLKSGDTILTEGDDIRDQFVAIMSMYEAAGRPRL